MYELVSIDRGCMPGKDAIRVLDKLYVSPSSLPKYYAFSPFFGGAKGIHFRFYFTLAKLAYNFHVDMKDVPAGLYQHEMEEARVKLMEDFKSLFKTSKEDLALYVEKFPDIVEWLLL